MELRLRVPPDGGLRAVRRPGSKTVRIYVCGPTVYGDAHVGHGRTYLVFDTVRRHLEANGQRVRLVMNITDFEDRIFERARTLGTPWRALARQAERRFLAELARLNLLPPQVTPRASEHIGEMRTVGKRLQRAGCVHREGGDLVYHPSRSHPSSRPLVVDLASRVVPEPDSTGGTPDESNLREFAIWQAPRPGGPRWPSPWGPGTPGWHLECYVMARKYLGLPVDLHGGGRDLMFPHHYAENEIAETLDHRPFARRFLHTAFVLQDGEKMAKSTGHLVRLRTAIDLAGAGAVRWYLLSRHYAAG
ncbi:MAG: cysteine--tRNA ligase, partial [Thermoplasmata archaeon]|nr:cysteine--tRNA ligase [Thermoplasmata archaeon]